MLEGKIVNVINKMINGKGCVKEILHVVERMGRLGWKEMSNRYIVSGFETIVKLVIEKNEN